MPKVVQAMLMGARIGALAAALTSMFFGRHFFEALIFTALTGFIAGSILGLVAYAIQTTWLRRLALVAVGPIAVFCVQLLLLEIDPPTEPIFAIALGTALCAIPGLLGGVFWIDRRLYPEPPGDRHPQVPTLNSVLGIRRLGAQPGQLSVPETSDTAGAVSRPASKGKLSL